jgi:nucleoside-triphosphatase
MSPKVLITGSPGSGKSTMMLKLIEDLRPRRVAGLSTPEVRRRGAREGFKMIDLANGVEEVLAMTHGSGPAVGKYRVNVAGVDEMVRRIRPTLDSADLICIDEIGKMELFSTEFEKFVDHAFSLDKPMIAVVHRSFVSRYRNRGQVFSVTRANFEQVRQSILAEFRHPDLNCRRGL